jgi:hypothetical protein
VGPLEVSSTETLSHPIATVTSSKGRNVNIYNMSHMPKCKSKKLTSDYRINAVGPTRPSNLMLKVVSENIMLLYEKERLIL